MAYFLRSNDNINSGLRFKYFNRELITFPASNQINRKLEYQHFLWQSSTKIISVSFYYNYFVSLSESCTYGLTAHYWNKHFDNCCVLGKFNSFQYICKLDLQKLNYEVNIRLLRAYTEGRSIKRARHYSPIRYVYLNYTFSSWDEYSDDIISLWWTCLFQRNLLQLQLRITIVLHKVLKYCFEKNRSSLNVILNQECKANAKYLENNKCVTRTIKSDPNEIEKHLIISLITTVILATALVDKYNLKKVSIKKKYRISLEYWKLRITSVLIINIMDNKRIYKICSNNSNIFKDSLETMISPTSDEHLAIVSNSAEPHNIAWSYDGQVCQSLKARRFEEDRLYSDLFHCENQQQWFRSTSSVPSWSFVQRRLLHTDKTFVQSPWKHEVKYYEHTLSDSRHVASEHGSVNIQTHTDTPKEIIKSPKKNASENAVIEQNSPTPTDHVKDRVLNSPKQFFCGEIYTSSTSSPFFGHISEQVCNFASPLLSSAVYKNGNYFKFPEVDSLAHDNHTNVEQSLSYLNMVGIPAESSSVSISTKEDTRFSFVEQNQSPEYLGTRRVRLKSMSLDSDGARLIEENLGIPVEELIEYAKETPKYIGTEQASLLTNKDSGFFNNTASPLINNATHQIMLSPIPTPKQKGSQINKKKLKINIDKGNIYNLLDTDYKNDTSQVLKLQTPKTPTLTQSKYKAVSLDSSDMNNACYCSIPSIRNNQIYQYASTNIKSVHNLSSISVPSTPKRHINANRRKHFGKNMNNAKPNTLKIPSSQISSTLSESAALDCNSHHSNYNFEDDRSLRISIDFDENFRECVNEMEDDDNIENYYLGEISDDAIVLESEETNISNVDHTDSKQHYRGGGKITDVDLHPSIAEYVLLAPNLQTQKFGMLSLSNNNLETLPEVMSQTDFDNSPGDGHQDGKCFETNEETKLCATKPTVTRSNILQRRGSNQSLTISLNINGSLGNLTKCMSSSNYSLGSLNGSNYNLSTYPLHQHNMYFKASSNASSTMSILARGNCSSQVNILPQQNYFECDMNLSDTKPNKKNILQRRGSNTSLTLNIKGSNSPNLSRFSSHSSLNISGMQQTVNAISANSKPKHIGQTKHCHPPQTQQYYQSQLLKQPQISKKGLLERRNSNASLTLNIRSGGLNSSNCNLKSSASSLTNIANASSDSLDVDAIELTRKGNLVGIVCTELDSILTEKRKFLSSENLNSIAPQYSKLNQTHFRNSTKTCFGSVSDLKPKVGSNSDYLTSNYSQEQDIYPSGSRQFEQTSLCSCTGVRNITTKPLSPQSTSEDFKIYLANIQLLQNATNVLTEETLRTLHYVFEENYEMPKSRLDNPKISENFVGFSTNIHARDQKIENNCQQQVSERKNQFLFDPLPNGEEKKNLLRSLHEEFWDLPTNHQEKPLVFGSQTKNRYKTILPNEHSRVVLKMEIGSLQEPYINANYIKGPDYVKNSYIVTQGPLPNTIYDYWLMVQQNADTRQEKLDRSDALLSPTHVEYSGRLDSKEISFHSQKIVMLTNFVENSQQKCSVYFPTELNQIIFITNSNDKFENAEIAEFYETYLNASGGSNSLHDIDLEIKIEDLHSLSSGGFRTLNDIPKQNFFIIKNSGVHEKGGYSIRKLTVLYVVTKLKDDNLETKDRPRAIVSQMLKRFTCFHYWFPDWPDHHSPEDVGLLLDMSLHLLDVDCDREFQQISIPVDIAIQENSRQWQSKSISVLEPMLSKKGDVVPIPIIHCSAGIGRTGCLAAILNGIGQIRNSVHQTVNQCNYQLNSLTVAKPRKKYVNVDILGIVCNLRLQRGGMVQNSEQYELIHRALCLYQSRIDTEFSKWGGVNYYLNQHQIYLGTDEVQNC